MIWSTSQLTLRENCSRKKKLSTPWLNNQMRKENEHKHDEAYIEWITLACLKTMSSAPTFGSLRQRSVPKFGRGLTIPWNNPSAFKWQQAWHQYGISLAKKSFSAMCLFVCPRRYNKILNQEHKPWTNPVTLDVHDTGASCQRKYIKTHPNQAFSKWGSAIFQVGFSS